MATSLQCQPLNTPTRRKFWTTSLDSCVPDTCGTFTCGKPGLSLVENEDKTGASFATNDWVMSTALNMLMTDARRRDTKCGYAPGTLNGHWSESFIQQQGAEIGTHVRYIDPKLSVRDAVMQIKAEVQMTLNKLVKYGIAIEVIVHAQYQGEGRVALDIEILGSGIDPTRIALSAKRSDNSWAWVQ
jgi:phage gp46-like protein